MPGPRYVAVIIQLLVLMVRNFQQKVLVTNADVLKFTLALQQFNF